MTETFRAHPADFHDVRDRDGHLVGRYVEDLRLTSDAVRFDEPLLGDIAGKRGLHLQCRLGTDTLSLARRGAFMTGLDSSSIGVAEARRLVAESGDEVVYVETDVYDAVTALDAERFDFVYSSLGALECLPDVHRWARVVAQLIEPGGFVLVRVSHDDAAHHGTRPAAVVTALIAAGFIVDVVVAHDDPDRGGTVRATKSG